MNEGETVPISDGLRKLSGHKIINYFVCQNLVLVYSYFFRWYLGPRAATPTVRHISQIIIGVCLACMVFGWGILHLLVGAGVSYVLILTFNPRVVQYYVFAYAMLHLSWVHIYMQMMKAGVGNLDYIGPMMLLTVKTSSLAYGLHDGFTKEEARLNKLQKELVVRRYPRFLEYWSYIFSPQSLLVGPICYFADYVKFIEGKNFTQKVTDENGEERIVYLEPSSVRAVTSKLLFALLCGVALLVVVPKVPISANASHEILNNPFWYKFGYLLVSIEVAKTKYFCAWVWADSINNAAGLGFNGYDRDGRPLWNGLTSVDIIDFEMATNLKTLIETWNKRCAMWLKYVCYDRVPTGKRLLTFILSAMWHGFYPGYFVAFLTAALLMAAAGKVRYTIRPYFLSSPRAKLFYDVATWACTYVSLAYLITPFTLLQLNTTIQFFNSYYWFPHILAIVLILVLPSRPAPEIHKTTEKPRNENGNGIYHNGGLAYSERNDMPSIRNVVLDTQETEARKER